MSVAEHYPPSLPRLTWFGQPADVTGGDVDAILAGCVRLLRGETIVATARRGDRDIPVAIAMTGSGAVNVVVDGSMRTLSNAYDALVYAYGEINNFNVAWAAFEGRDE